MASPAYRQASSSDPRQGVELKVEDGSLAYPLAAHGALTTSGDEDARHSRDADGYVDTGDMLELRDGRYYFSGRRGGIINVGGLKVHPEEVEAVINRHPRVQMSLVRSTQKPGHRRRRRRGDRAEARVGGTAAPPARTRR